MPGSPALRHSPARTVPTRAAEPRAGATRAAAHRAVSTRAALEASDGAVRMVCSGAAAAFPVRAVAGCPALKHEGPSSNKGICRVEAADCFVTGQTRQGKALASGMVTGA